MNLVKYDIYSDEDLVSLLKEGDHLAYEIIYHRYFRLLFVHAYKKLRDREQAKDIVQELFTNLWVKRDILNFTTNISGYFFTVINNKIVDYFLHKGVQEKYIASFSGFLNTENIKADHLIREKQLALLIQNEIKQLPPKMREIFEMSRKEYLTHKQIAEKLELSEKTVDRQVSNALFRLRTKLGLFTFLLFLIKF